MNNFRKVNDDIIKEWLEFREETEFCNMIVYYLTTKKCGKSFL